MSKKAPLAILGNGRLALFLAQLLSPHRPVTLFISHPSTLEKLKVLRRHPLLPQFTLPPNAALSADIEEAMEDAEMVFLCQPAATLPSLCQDLALFLSEEIPLCVGTKGICQGLAFATVQKSFPKNPTLNLLFNGLAPRPKLVQILVAFGQEKFPLPLPSPLAQYLLFSPPHLLDWAGTCGKLLSFVYGFLCGSIGSAALGSFWTPYLEWVQSIYAKQALPLTLSLGPAGLGHWIPELADSTNPDRALGEHLAEGHDLPSSLRLLSSYTEVPHLLPYFLQNTPRHPFLELCRTLLHDPKEALQEIKQWLQL